MNVGLKYNGQVTYFTFFSNKLQVFVSLTEDFVNPVLLLLSGFMHPEYQGSETNIPSHHLLLIFGEKIFRLHLTTQY